MRTHIKDVVTIGVGFSSILGVGNIGSIEMNFIVRGPHASLKPIITTTQGIGAGGGVDIGWFVGGQNYCGSLNDLSPDMLETNSADGDGDKPTLWLSYAVELEEMRGGTITATPPSKKNAGFVGEVTNMGGSVLPTFGKVTSGTSNTFILFKF